MIFVSDIPFDYLWQRPQELSLGLDSDIYLYPGKLKFGLRGYIGNTKLVALPVWHFNSKYKLVNFLCLKFLCKSPLLPYRTEFSK